MEAAAFFFHSPWKAHVDKSGPHLALFPTPANLIFHRQRRHRLSPSRHPRLALTTGLDADGVPEGSCGTEKTLFRRRSRAYGRASWSLAEGESDFSNGYLDTPLDWMPGTKKMQLKHVTAVVRTTDPNSIYLKFLRDEMRGSHRASAMVLNTFADLEGDVLDAMSAILPPIYPIGPLTKFCSQAPDTQHIGSSLWGNDSTCLEWLEGKAAGSVLYVNFGSLAMMSNERLVEFAWGMAESGYDFLWVIRNKIAMGQNAILPEEFSAETSGRGMLASWCPQEEVLMHPSVGGFLTHCGWNSVTESLSAGVPMLCWPLAADQHANCLYACTEWGVGMQVESDAKREGVAALIREVMGGERGKEMRSKALRWKECATRTTERGGKSFEKLECLINEVLLR